MGETYTICDPDLFTVAEWPQRDGVDLGRVPRVIDHRNRMSERPARQPRESADRTAARKASPPAVSSSRSWSSAAGIAAGRLMNIGEYAYDFTGENSYDGLLGRGRSPFPPSAT